jgi:hypothetical protein
MLLIDGGLVGVSKGTPPRSDGGVLYSCETLHASVKKFTVAVKMLPVFSDYTAPDYQGAGRLFARCFRTPFPKEAQRQHSGDDLGPFDIRWPLREGCSRSEFPLSRPDLGEHDAR